jgi:hypothetical protein
MKENMASRRTAMASEPFRLTLHSVALRLGHKPDPTKPALADSVHDPSLARQIQAENIETIGFRLSYAQERALHALCVLLDRTDYKGNAPSTASPHSRYHFNGSLPVMQMKVSKFLAAYGVKKYQTKRGYAEYSRPARTVAVAALNDLAENRFLLMYSKSVNAKSRKMVPIEAVAPLVTLNWSSGGRQVTITPNPVLVDQFDSYYVLVPEDLFQQIPGTDSVMVRFILFLFYHAEMKRRAARKKVTSLEIRLSPDTIAWNLRLDSLIRSRKKTELRRRLNELYAYGVAAGYLVSYDIDQPATNKRTVDILRLNTEKFKYLVPKRAKSGTKSRKP